MPDLQPDPIGPDPNRTITPGGFHSDSPFARQYQAPQPVEKKPQPAANPVAVDMRDLEEAYHRLEEQIQNLEGAPREVVASAGGQNLIEELESVRDLIYRNLR